MTTTQLKVLLLSLTPILIITLLFIYAEWISDHLYILVIIFAIFSMSNPMVKLKLVNIETDVNKVIDKHTWMKVGYFIYLVIWIIFIIISIVFFTKYDISLLGHVGAAMLAMFITIFPIYLIATYMCYINAGK